MKTVWKLWATVAIPKEKTSRTILVALRCGMITVEGCEYLGYDNRFTRWAWRLVLEAWPSQRLAVIELLKASEPVRQ